MTIHGSGDRQSDRHPGLGRAFDVFWSDDLVTPEVDARRITCAGLDVTKTRPALSR